MRTKIQIIKRARELIGKDELSKAIDLLHQIAESKSHANTLTIQKARNKNIETQINKGIISYEASLIEKNKIRNTLLEISSSIEDEYDKLEHDLDAFNGKSINSKETFTKTSTFSLLVSVCLLLLLVFAKPLQFQGVLQDRVFYILLISMGISSALFLHGVLKSNPILTGSLNSKEVRFGGPSLFAILIIIGGFWIIPRDSFFDLTIRAIEKRSGKTVYSERKAQVQLFLPTGIRNADFTKNGEAVIKAVPKELLNSEQKILTDIYYYKQDTNFMEFKLTTDVIDIEHFFDATGTTTGILNKRSAHIMLLELLIPFRLMLIDKDYSETNITQYCEGQNQNVIKIIDLNSPIIIAKSELNYAFDILIEESPVSLNIIKGKNYKEVIHDSAIKFKQKANLLSQIDLEGISPEIQRDIIIISQSNYVNIAAGTQNIDSSVLEILLSDLCVTLNGISERNNLNPFMEFIPM